MVRIVVIDTDREQGQALALAGARDGVAVRLAETVSEGVRYLLDEPVSAVLVDAGLIRLAAAEQARLFQSVTPGLAMVVLAAPDMRDEDRVRFQVEGFHVVGKPLDVREMLAKIEPHLLTARSARGATRTGGV